MVKKERIGIVASNKNLKTIVILVQMKYQHPKYGKTVVKTKRYMAHDETNSCKPGDLVLIEESRPISHLKRWRLKKILRVFEK